MKVIWSMANDNSDFYNLSPEEKRRELTNVYDQEFVDQLSDEELDRAYDDGFDSGKNLIDFQENIAPMIANQMRLGLILDDKDGYVDMVDPGHPDVIGFDDMQLLEDDDHKLYFKHNGKVSPVVGFSDDEDEYIHQLEELGIADAIRRIYDDVNIADYDVYDIADMIPSGDETMKVLTQATNMSGLFDESLVEAKAKDSSKLSKELEEIKDLAEEYGFEYFTQMPFTSFDNDPISVEYQYPEFFRVVKAFFKEMGILEGEDLTNPDILDMSWDQDISQHDWDVLMRACDKLAKGKGVQFEKEYKTGYNSVLDDDEIMASREDESLNENTDDINPELYKPFGHDSYDSGYIHEPEIPAWYDPEEDEPSILPPNADDEDWDDDLNEDTATWPWGDPEQELPRKKVQQEDNLDIDKYL